MSSFRGAKNPSFGSGVGAEISHKLVVIVQHMENQPGTTLFRLCTQRADSCEGLS